LLVARVAWHEGVITFKDSISDVEARNSAIALVVVVGSSVALVPARSVGSVAVLLFRLTNDVGTALGHLLLLGGVHYMFTSVAFVNFVSNNSTTIVKCNVSANIAVRNVYIDVVDVTIHDNIAAYVASIDDDVI